MNEHAFRVSLLAAFFAGSGFLTTVIANPEEDAPPETAEKPAPIATSTQVELKTSMGKIVLQLDDEKAPETVKNFVSYVNDGFYNGTIFHRVIDGFMIQGGGFKMVEDEGIQQKTKAPIKNEARTSGLSNTVGTIAMARTGDPDSATAQFFINVKDNVQLDPGGFSPDGYAVFGKVIEGMDVVNKIKGARTRQSFLQALLPNGELRKQPMRDVPVEAITIESARVLKKEQPPK